MLKVAKMLKVTRGVYPPEVKVKALELMRGTNNSNAVVHRELEKFFKKEIKLSVVAYWRYSAGIPASKRVSTKSQVNLDKVAADRFKRLNLMWKVEKK